MSSSSIAEHSNFPDRPAPRCLTWDVTTKDAYRKPPAENIIAALKPIVGFSDAHLSLIETALHEAILNAVIHGNLGLDGPSQNLGEGDVKAFEAFYGAIEKRLTQPELAQRPIHISAVFDNNELSVSVTDQGKGFVEEDLTPSPRHSGRGLLVIRSVADEATYDLGGRRVTMVFHP